MNPLVPGLGWLSARPKALSALVAGLLAIGALSPLGSSQAAAQTRDDNPHGRIDILCSTCHSPDNWKPARITKSFDHARYGFELAGGHGSVICASCHRSLEFTKVTNTCASCHQDTHRGELGADCAQCHNVRSFSDRAQQINHSLTRFPLEGAHRTLDCRNCHTPGLDGTLAFRGAPTTCFACHRGAFEKTLAPSHVAATFSSDCTRCHNKATWRGASYDHSLSDFALTGAHKAVTCQACHADRVFTGKSKNCVSCHQVNFEQALAPPHQAAHIDRNCVSCHTTAAWSGASYDHNVTQFPLTGAHKAVDCATCHANGNYVGRPATCISCHQTVFDQTVAPPHKAAGFSPVCSTCHNTATWPGATFNHATTKFPLAGAHQAVACRTCHADGVYVGKATTCVACHQPNFDQTKAPPHKTAGLSTDCVSCHATATWQGAKFDHNTTRFSLTGAHRVATCQSCHADGVYVGKAATCVACHQASFDKTVNPNHKTAGFPTDCTSCHTTTTWDGAKFDHNATLFPLTGAHQTATCQSCHADGVFKGKPTTCVACHQGAFDKTAQPNHKAAGFPTNCTSCHTTVTWNGAKFDHNATLFPLTGAHQTATCQSCHADGIFKGKATTCASCHQTTFDKTTNPSHKTAGFSLACQTCHTTATWPGAKFDHGNTAFPLTGAHQAATCQSCHADGVFKGKPTTCASCHQGDFDKTTAPKHQTASFPTTCTTCHTTTAWIGATFNHGTTAFPLTGAHLAATCQACHVNGVYKGTPTTCVACHQTDFAKTTNPNHTAAKFPTTCATCHTTAIWLGGTFNHTATAFPLTGAHVAATCKACHADNVFAGKATTCVSCHVTDFNATVNPNHKTAGFPTDCLSCHTTARWLGATFAHDAQYFRIYSGKHQGQWATCATCHTNSANYKEFTCLTCHEHSKTTMDNTHQGRSGYSYTSPACLSCHPRV